MNADDRDRPIGQPPPPPRPPAATVEELRAMLAGMNNENDWARP